MPAAGAPGIDDVFGVLAHPVRRQLLERLAGGERRVTDLAGPVAVSRSAVSQHLRLMRSVGVVAERRAGRERYYRLERDRLGEVESWLMRIDRFWERGFRRLGEHLDAHP
ncbi:MAG TPA: metalloregulator ArsR/SmtB family transcription factor [Acidimicrobiia bacterium]|nr:metalloregulator ArsR/SmtB family transcription factor [Acidimicrobiia bacterium]